VLYQPGPMIKLVDFGIAKVEALDLTATGEFIGTPSYMSPEIFSGERLDGRSDLFSLGVILYQLLTGSRPFEAETVSRTIYRVLHEEPTPPSQRRRGLSPLWDIICSRLLEKNPDDRYRSAAGVVEDLDALERGTLVVQEPTQPIPASSRRRRFVGMAALSLLSILLIGGVGWWSMHRPEPSERSGVRKDLSVLLTEAERGLDEGRLDESESALNALLAHSPEYPGAQALTEQLQRAQFRESLPLRLVARHEHLVGHCTGDLFLREDGIVFESSRHGPWHWHIDEIETLEREGDDLTIRVASDTYHLTFIRPGLSDEFFDRYRTVLETARAESSPTR
jgi:serine/threonine protein kinase